MYKVVYAENSTMSEAIEEIEDNIYELKLQGWKEQGGISVAVETCGWIIAAQAMTKDEDDESEPVVNKSDIVINSLS